MSTTQRNFPDEVVTMNSHGLLAFAFGLQRAFSKFLFLGGGVVFVTNDGMCMASLAGDFPWLLEHRLTKRAQP